MRKRSIDNKMIVLMLCIMDCITKLNIEDGSLFVLLIIRKQYRKMV